MMRNNDEMSAEVPTSWSEAIRIIGAGHLLGLVLCGTALAASGVKAVVIDWLEIAALLFALGAVTSIVAFALMRSASSYQDGMRQFPWSPAVKRPIDVSSSYQRSIQHLVIACLLALGSAVAFFCACATGLMAFLQS